MNYSYMDPCSRSEGDHSSQSSRSMMKLSRAGFGGGSSEPGPLFPHLSIQRLNCLEDSLGW